MGLNLQCSSSSHFKLLHTATTSSFHPGECQLRLSYNHTSIRKLLELRQDSSLVILRGKRCVRDDGSQDLVLGRLRYVCSLYALLALRTFSFPLLHLCYPQGSTIRPHSTSPQIPPAANTPNPPANNPQASQPEYSSSPSKCAPSSNAADCGSTLSSRA
jgi:hypothetical protein